MTTFRPMKGDPAVLEKLRFPLLGSPKLDGIRGVVLDRGAGPQLLSAKLLPIPNAHTYSRLSVPATLGFDGELVVGPARGQGVIQRTTSGLMRRDGAPDCTFWVFDKHDVDAPYETRLKQLEKAASLYVRNTLNVTVLPQKLITSADDLLSFEHRMVTEGFEGVMLRDPRGRYKHGRATVKEGLLLKLKRFEDAEAEVIGFEEEQENQNEATRDELGRTKRSSAKAGKVGKGVLGAFIVRDLKTAAEFTVGGFTAAQKKEFWATRDQLLKTIIKYKFFPVGVKDKPRHPTFLCFRSPADLTD